MDNPQPNTDEIDLLRLLANLTRFVLKNWLIIALSLASCILLSWLSYRRASPVYASEMVVQSKFLSETYASQVIKILQKQLGDDSVVAARLNLTRAEASMIKRISVTTPFSDKVSMLEEDKVIYLLSVEISDPRVLPRLQSGLVYFFENLEFIKLRVATRKKGYQDLINRIDYEIGRADSTPGPKSGSLYPLQQSYEKRIVKKRNPREPELQFQTPVIYDPSTMTVFMTKDRNEAQERLALILNGIEVIQGFAPSSGPVAPNLSIYLASGFSSGVLLALLLLGLRSVQWLFKKYPA